MRIFYKIAGVVFIVGCFFFFQYNYKELKTYHNGHIVYATVTYVPNCLTTKKHYNFKFAYNGRTYAKKIGVLSCRELSEADTIKLKTNRDNSVFLFENENPYNDMVSFVLLFLFGVFLIYMGYKK